MSQAGLIAVTASVLPPTVPTSFDTNAGTATPALNNLDVLGTVNIVTSGATNVISIRGDILTYVQPGAYPYNPLSTDYFISVDTSAARTIRLPNAPTTGKSYVIKDRTGSAAANNITVTTVGGAVLIDGLASQTMADNFESMELLFNGTSYEIF